MRRMESTAWIGILLVSAALIPAAALAKSPPPPLPTCLNGLGSEVQRIVSPLLPGAIVSGTLTTTIVPAAAANPGGTPGTPTPYGEDSSLLSGHIHVLHGCLGTVCNGSAVSNECRRAVSGL